MLTCMLLIGCEEAHCHFVIDDLAKELSLCDNIALSSAVVGTHFLGFVDMSDPDCVQGGTLSLVMDECANIMTNMSGIGDVSRCHWLYHAPST